MSMTFDAGDSLNYPNPCDGPDRDRDPWEPRSGEHSPRVWPGVATTGDLTTREWCDAVSAFSAGNPEQTRAAMEWTRRQLGESRDV